MTGLDELKITVEEIIRKHETELQLASSVPWYDVYQTIKFVMRENPDLFWFSHQWKYDTDGVVRFHYTMDDERCEKIKAQIDDVVEHDFKIAHVRSLPKVEQVMYVYKWIALYCSYNILSAHNQTIYSVFVHRTSVCTGIAKAAQYLLNLLGIESRLVFGKMVNSPKNSRHCWIIVKIENKWYHLDPTFALPDTEYILLTSNVVLLKGPDYLLYNYFCIDTKNIKLSRSIEEEDTLPNCIDTIDYKEYWNIDVLPSRNGKNGGLGCLLSDSGTTADIYLAHDKGLLSFRHCVAKVFRNDEDRELLRKELIIMRSGGYSNLLRATDADFERGILYMEQATPLAELLGSSYFKLTIHDFCNLLINIASGLRDLLHNGIYYRDIHLNNIYLSNTDYGCDIYKLGDFGSCAFVDEDNRYFRITTKGGVGSKWYLAPETLKSGVFDERSVVYGVGMIAYFLLNNLYPPLWQDYGEDSLIKRMFIPKLPMPVLLNDKRVAHISFEFIIKALRNDVGLRQQTLEELLKDIADFLSIYQKVGTIILIDGSSYNQDGEGVTTNNFCSTCTIDPNIKVSNEEVATPISTKGEELEEKRAKLKRKLLSSSKLKITPSDNLMTIPQGKLCGPSSIDDFATTSCFDFGRDEFNNRNSKRPKTFFPQAEKEAENIDSSHAAICTSNILIHSLLKTIKSLFKWGKNKHKSTLCPCKVNTSVFAPSEVKHGDYMMVQVFLYMDEEEQAVDCKAKEVDNEAERRNYKPLSVKLKEGDKVKVFLQTPSKDVQVENPIQKLTWQGRFTDCQFAVYINKDFSASTLLSTVVLSINNSPVGRMMFKTKIADNPRALYAEVECKTLKKIFISYSHKDEARVKYIAEAYKAQGVDYFFDRHYLKAGDIYPARIRQYIDSADLFILCWSKNAAESDYVALERNQALSHAYPQVSMDKASISIHPISIEPRTAYPQDMNDVYNFEEV